MANSIKYLLTLSQHCKATIFWAIGGSCAADFGTNGYLPGRKWKHLNFFFHGILDEYSWVYQTTKIWHFHWKTKRLKHRFLSERIV